MHYPTLHKNYDDGLKRVSTAIMKARAGEYREGYLGMIVEALELLVQMSHHVGAHHRDGAMLARLMDECREQMEAPTKELGESPLADLLREHREPEPEPEPKPESRPFQPRRM